MPPKNTTNWQDANVHFEYKLRIKTMSMFAGNYGLDRLNVTNPELWSFEIDKQLTNQLSYLCSLEGVLDDQRVEESFIQISSYAMDVLHFDKGPCYCDDVVLAKVNSIITARRGWIDTMTGELLNCQHQSICHESTRSYFSGVGSP